MATPGTSELPLTPPLLLEVLQAASSPSQELVHQATAQLKKWEKESGFFSLLQVRDKDDGGMRANKG